MRLHLLVLLLALGATSCALERPASTSLAGTMIDLSHDYSDQTVFWPTAESFTLDKVADGMTPQGLLLCGQ